MVVNKILSFSPPSLLSICRCNKQSSSSVFFPPFFSINAFSRRILANTRRKSRYEICKINSANYARTLSVVEINSWKSRGDSNQIVEYGHPPCMSLDLCLSLVIQIVNRRAAERLVNDRRMYQEISHELNLKHGVSVGGAENRCCN